ncbi:MAG TPA: hypothetical protein PLZ53_03220 [Candidatus Hydrogenedentes bacterium]|nr:hypothetical protein [Candidatus Hydrogenedentota bacterium]
MRPMPGKPLKPYTPLDHLCPFFTRFPLSFPLNILENTYPPKRVFDPFCGCGTTLLAASVTGHFVSGMDIHPVACAVSRAKLASATAEEVIAKAEQILETTPVNTQNKQNGFWNLCFHSSVYEGLLRLRERYLQGNLDQAEARLYGIVLGILHGPLQKSKYLSNDMPATFAPPQDLLSAHWQARGSKPPPYSLQRLIAEKARQLPILDAASGSGVVQENSFLRAEAPAAENKFDLIITSPPYYGLPNKNCGLWLRSWLLGDDEASASQSQELHHQSLTDYINDLGEVWKKAASFCRPGASLYLHFGKVHGSGAYSSLDVLHESVKRASTGWTVRSIDAVKTAAKFMARRNFASPSPPPEDEWRIQMLLNN